MGVTPKDLRGKRNCQMGGQDFQLACKRLGGTCLPRSASGMEPRSGCGICHAHKNGSAGKTWLLCNHLNASTQSEHAHHLTFRSG